jgi:hypothetical protein
MLPVSTGKGRLTDRSRCATSLTEDPSVAAILLDKAIAGCEADDVEEIRSLGNTLKSWRGEILAHHQSGASNGPTEG